MNQMKKHLFVFAFCLSLSSHANTPSLSPIVNLTGTGVVAPTSSLNVSLNGLIPSVAYSVVCYINTTFPFHFIQLGSTLSDTTSSIISYNLNGNQVTQDQLIVGKNTAVINGIFITPSTSDVVFTNLDQANSFNVTSCFGIPIQAQL